MPGNVLFIRFVLLALISVIVGLLTHFIWGLNPQQTISVTVFLVIILSTLFFWDFRLAIAFLGLPVLMLTGTMEMESFKEHSSLEVILFLVGMMVVVGGLRDLGFFTWIIQGILQREKNMPVMEIMEFADQYATVDESTPAIQVARIMMRREVRQVFVVKNKKLMGIISIQDLIQKVLRA